MSSDPTDVVSYQAGNKFSVHTPGADSEDEDCCIVKGFVSVQTPDRSGDLVKPEAFDIASYMAQPAVLVNHQLWRNRLGNEVGVGVPVSLHEVKVRTSIEEGMWSIFDVNAKKEVDTFPKDRNPNIGIGTRGLYAFIRITDPDVNEMISNGELSGFSWRGMSKPNYVHDAKTNQTHKSYSYIDLIEITLATAPDNRASSFVVQKDAIHSYRFDKKSCTKATVAQQLAMDGLSYFKVVEDDNTYFAYNANRELNEDGLLVVKMATGLSIVVGRPETPVTATLSNEENTRLLTAIAKSKETPMATTTTQTPPVVTEEIDASKTTPPVTTPEATVPPVAAPFNLEEFITKAVAGVLEKVTPVLDTLAGQVQALALSQQDLVSKMTAVTPPVETPEPPALQPDVLLEVQKKLDTFAVTMEAVQKSLGGITPARTPRAEVITTPTTPKPAPPAAHPNDVFNNLFGT